MTGKSTIRCTPRLQFPSFLVAFVLLAALGSCDSDKSNRPSPFAADSVMIDGKLLYIHYSSPAVKGREIWGVLDPYDEVWRIGANEATIFKTDRDLLFGTDSVLLPQGKYALFAIPREDEWTLIFNNDWDQWGSYNYDESLDQLRLDVMPTRTSTLQERLLFDLSESSLRFHWEYLTFELPLP